MKKQTETKPVRSLSVIAKEIRSDWKNVSPHAEVYLGPMQTLDKITDNYFADTAKYVVLYFLANATSWRGEKAREIKKELNAMCK